MLSPEKEYFKGSPLFYWATIVALLAVAFISTWSCSAWKGEAEIKQSHLRESLDRLEEASTENERLFQEVDKGNHIIQQQGSEITRLDREVNKGNRIIQQQNSEIALLGREVYKASQVIQQQNAVLECFSKRSNDTGFLSGLANLLFPGAGGMIVSALDQQQDC